MAGAGLHEVTLVGGCVDAVNHEGYTRPKAFHEEADAVMSLGKVSFDIKMFTLSVCGLHCTTHRTLVLAQAAPSDVNRLRASLASQPSRASVHTPSMLAKTDISTCSHFPTCHSNNVNMHLVV